MEGNSKLLQWIHTQIYDKCLKINATLDNRISKNLREAGIKNRPVKSNGLWCPILLPTVLILYALLYKVPPVYTLTAIVSISLLCYSLLFIVFISISCLILKEPIYGGCIASSLVSTVLLYTLSQQDLMFSLIFTLPTMYFYSTLLRLSLTKFPKTFTIGEAMIVAQAIVLFGTMTLAKFVYNFIHGYEVNFINTFVYTGLTTVGLIIIALSFLSDEQRNIGTLGFIMTAGSVFALLVLHLVLGPGCIPKLVYYILVDQKRVQLFAFWLFLVLVVVFVLQIRTKMAVKATTAMRKSFHVLASLVFLSGILFDEEFMKFAAGIGLGLLILLEALRKSGIEPISSALQSVFLVYSDEKDCGSFAMTPVYLYAGLACPLILVPEHRGRQLELLSGVLSIGIGDTAASFFGSRYGIYKWADSNRTIEGTACNILSQIGIIYALQFFGLLSANNALIRIAIASTVSAMIEAKTDQVDNLILPLTTIIAFQVTSFLC